MLDCAIWCWNRNYFDHKENNHNHKKPSRQHNIFMLQYTILGKNVCELPFNYIDDFAARQSCKIRVFVEEGEWKFVL